MTKWTINVAPEDLLPAKMKGKGSKCFMLAPPVEEIGPLPLTPKMSEQMHYSHTWDGGKSSLSVMGDPKLIQTFLVEQFTDAGRRLTI